MSVATSFVNYHDISGDPAARCKQVLDAAANKNFATLLRRHVDDFRGLMSRVHLNVGDAALRATPTDQRLQAVRAGGNGFQSRGALLPIRPVHPGIQQPRRRPAG
jgi:alpha-L-fucosidase 2